MNDQKINAGNYRSNINFGKYSDGLVPAIIQDGSTRTVLMLGFMNEDSLETTFKTGLVTFYSRSKQRLWTKGEESGNVLNVLGIYSDCDNDTLLIKASPRGPVCHTGADTCWGEINRPGNFTAQLEAIIADRKAEPGSKSYTSSLFEKGINKIAQKVGEEAVELVIEAMDNNDHLFKEEAADLYFHYLVLLRAKGFGFDDIEKILKERHEAK